MQLREFTNLVTQCTIKPCVKRGKTRQVYTGDNFIGDGKLRDASGYYYPDCDCCRAYSRSLRR